MIILLTVVLPEPLSPTSARLSPRRMVKETSSTAVMTVRRAAEPAAEAGDEGLAQALDLEQVLALGLIRSA